ncbi:phage major capsid protein [Kaistia dalseonensis]|uniref:HK97 family phage major capsid protein n=1 Tax=Kaistia dalseonensis TaxID=410840 RepID=A0ABU0HDA1_9HYPH|nr:phage major capsid protein [Kaistia dalseonensis]MCX5497656.1 phage major capsid protein [Kaistia dalseonensis]MDQ0440300.1 HK97 family phage major capsid protein [Kaistia dalseonensis]
MTDVPAAAPEFKAAESGDVGAAFDDFMRAFEAFKETNDERLAEIEQKFTADIVTTDKLDRINKALDELTLKSRRPPLSAERAASRAPSEHKAAFESYIRAGDEDGYRRIEQKALSAGSNADGGYLVPVETETEIGKRLAAISPIRAIADVRQVSSGTYRKPFMTAGPAVGWAGETDARSQTTSPTIAALDFPAMELYAMPAATAALLDDSAVNIDEWIAAEVEGAFATQEGTAFVSGDGTNKPKGFLAYPTALESAWAWGKLGYLATGVSAALPASNPSDILVDLIYALKAGYRANARFVLNRRTQAVIRKLKDADGHYLWQPAAMAGGEASLLGFPVTEAEDMPDIAANALALAFGDFKRGYLVVDRLGVRVLRDPYSAKPYVLFYTTKRVGGGVQDFDAIKLLKFGTS